MSNGTLKETPGTVDSGPHTSPSFVKDNEAEANYVTPFSSEFKIQLEPVNEQEENSLDNQSNNSSNNGLQKPRHKKGFSFGLEKFL